MTAQTSMLHVRVDDETIAQATQTLAAIGMSVSDAVRLFLRRVAVDQAFPLELKVPNAKTRASIYDQIMVRKHGARLITTPQLAEAHADRGPPVHRSCCPSQRGALSWRAAIARCGPAL